MDRAMYSLIPALVFLLTLFAVSGEQRARCKTLYPPYAITSEDAQYVSDPYGDGTWDGRMFASKHSNGEDSLEMLRLSINPGHGWPPHRHLEADEWIYVISGAGSYAYWALEEAQPTELSVGPGHALYNPQGQLHQVWNTGSEPLVLLAVSKSLAPYEVLADWPEEPGGGVGYVPREAPWELSCAPGHEPDDGGDAAAAAAAAEFGEGGDAAEWAGEADAAGEGAEGAAAADGSDGDYASSSEDYGSDCGCGASAEPMSESAIAECMAEPDDDEEEAEYDADAYGGQYDDDDEEPEFPVDQPVDPPTPAHDTSEL